MCIRDRFTAPAFLLIRFMNSRQGVSLPFFLEPKPIYLLCRYRLSLHVCLYASVTSSFSLFLLLSLKTIVGNSSKYLTNVNILIRKFKVICWRHWFCANWSYERPPHWPVDWTQRLNKLALWQKVQTLFGTITDAYHWMSVTVTFENEWRLLFTVAS